MYEAHFGFSAKPFQLTPDPRFFYASACHKKALYYLQYGFSVLRRSMVGPGGEVEVRDPV